MGYWEDRLAESQSKLTTKNIKATEAQLKKYYKKAMAISSKNAEIPYYIGYLFSEQQKWDLASEYLKKSLLCTFEYKNQQWQ